MKKSSIICITTGFILVLIGMSALLTLPLILVKIIDNKLVLSQDSPSFALWKDLPVPIVQKFYFYNVTNPSEVRTSGAVPELQQIGPFVYDLNINKHDLNFTNDGQRVSFTEEITYHFNRNLSFSDQTLKITTLNAPLAIAMALMEDLNFAKRLVAEFVVNRLKEDFFIEKSIKELLFDGYPDVLTKLAPFLNPKIPYQTSFGWMYAKNQTNDGLFTVDTGKADISQLNSIETLNGLPELTFWSSSRCNAFNGAKNGELFNPISSRDKSLLFFRTDFCRVWSLVWQSVMKSRFDDLEVYHYFPADNTFANSSEYPPNSCFKPNPNNLKKYPTNSEEFDLNSVLNQIKELIDSEVFNNITETDLRNYIQKALNLNEISKKSPFLSKYREFPSGVFDLSACHYSAPTFMSNPHFLNADPYYLTTVSGLSPNASIHQTFLDIEPITGTPIELQLRLQLNVYINPLTKTFKQYRYMSEIHFPVFWQEFSIHVTDQIAHDLHWQLTGPSMIATIISALFVITGSLTLLLIVTKPVLKRCFRNNTSADNNNSVDTDTSALIDNAVVDDSNPTIS